MSTKVSKLTQANILALRDIGAEDEGVQIAENYVIFPADAESALEWVQAQMEELDNHTAHPYASLHAVVRKLSAQLVADATGATSPEDDDFRPQPGEFFQVWKGLGYDDNTFRVIEYAPVTAAPEKLQKLYGLKTLPTEGVHAWRLEKVPTGRGKTTRWAGVAFCAFPVEVMVPEGTMRHAFEDNGTFVLALTPAQTRERIAEIDAEFTERLNELLAEHGAADALDLPRDVWHKLERWRSEAYALAHGRDPKTREYIASSGGPTARPRRPGTRGGRSRPSSGACEHCGQPTKGGRFVPGHDAKLKGDLIRAAQSTEDEVRIPALAESALRAVDSSKWAIDPLDEDAAAVDALVLTDGFLVSRNAARANAHKDAG